MVVRFYALNNVFTAVFGVEDDTASTSQKSLSEPFARSVKGIFYNALKKALAKK